MDHCKSSLLSKLSHTFLLQQPIVVTEIIRQGFHIIITCMKNIIYTHVKYITKVAMKYISFNMIRRKRTWCYLLVVLYPFICFYLWSSDKKAIRTIHEKQILSSKSRTTTPSQTLRKKAYFQVNNDIEGPGKSSLSIQWTLFF